MLSRLFGKQGGYIPIPDSNPDAAELTVKNAAGIGSSSRPHSKKVEKISTPLPFQGEMPIFENPNITVSVFPKHQKQILSALSKYQQRIKPEQNFENNLKRIASSEPESYQQSAGGL